MVAQIKWYGDKLRAQIEREMNRRVKACCVLVLNHAKLLVSVEGAGKAGKAWTRKSIALGSGGTIKTKVLASGDESIVYSTKRKKAGRLIYGANPSKPGEPPHKQRGRLLASIAFEVNGMIGRVGTNYKVGRWLELGTRYMAARPWLRRALREMEPQIMAILRAPMKFAA